MSVKSTLAYEWHIPERVYIIHIHGIMTLELVNTAVPHVIDMLNAPGRSKPVHLIYNTGGSLPDPALPTSLIYSVTALLYRHPLTASLISVVGKNRFYGELGRAMEQVFARETQWGQVVETLNEALRFVHTVDASLPPTNI